MKFIIKMKKEPFISLLCLFLFTIVIIRFLWLGVFPPGMAPDEMDMVLSSKAIAETGRDISRAPFPLFFIKTWTGSRQTNLIPFLLSPYFKLIKPNLLTSRLPFVIINLLLGVGIVKVIRIFEKDKLLSLIIFFVFLVNPWVFVYSRVTFAAPVSLMFFVWGIYFLLRRKVKLVYSYAAFFFSSLCYMGSLFLIPPLVVALSIYEMWSQKNLIRKRALFLAVFIFLVGSYILTSSLIEDGTVGRREGELSVHNLNSYSQSVGNERRLTLEIPGKVLAINKYTLFLSDIIKNYYNVFNSNSLFLEGDPGFNFAFADHGLLYLVDFFLIIIGISVLAKQNKRWIALFVIIALISPLGAAASTVTYTFIYRTFPIVLVFVTLISLGLWSLVKTPIKLPALVLYLGFFASFCFYYFFQYPVRWGEKFGVAERVAVNVALREESRGSKVRVIDYYPYSVVNRITLYGSRGLNYTTPNQYYYELGNIIITNQCSPGNENVLIVDEKAKCNFSDKNYVVIQQQKDAGYRYKIYGIDICNQAVLNTYKRFHYLSDYSIEKLADEVFCNRWLFEAL